MARLLTTTNSAPLTENGEIVNPCVHEYAPEPVPDFDEMQRLIEADPVAQSQKELE